VVGRDCGQFSVMFGGKGLGELRLAVETVL
jgi:hypothetical protein